MEDGEDMYVIDTLDSYNCIDVFNRGCYVQVTWRRLYNFD